jgi:hypothetical protein
MAGRSARQTNGARRVSGVVDCERCEEGTINGGVAEMDDSLIVTAKNVNRLKAESFVPGALG